MLRNLVLLVSVTLLFCVPGEAFCGLLVHYAFEGNLNDSSGNGFNGFGNPGDYVTGPPGFGLALNFDSNAADEIEVSNAAVAFAGVNKQITVAFWQYGSTLQPRDDTVFSAHDASSPYQPLLNCNLPWGNENVYFDSWNVSGTMDRVSKNASSEQSQYKGQWNHWAFVKNADNNDIDPEHARIKIYLNSQLWFDSATAGYSIGDGTADINGISTFFIGSAYGSRYYYDGAIDDFRIYDSELSAAEIAFLSKTSKTSKPVPICGAQNVPADTALRWTPAELAESYNIYLGTDSNDVANATVLSPELVGTCTDTILAVTGGLKPGVTYYWRVDSVSAENTCKGDIWTFTTAPAYAALQLNEDTNSVEIGNGVQKVVFASSQASDMLVTGKFGSAVAFSANAADKLTIGSVSQFNSSNRTVEFWVKLSPSSTFQVMIARGPKQAGHWEIYANSSGKLAYYIKTSSADNIGESNFYITDDLWHFLSFRVSSSQAVLAVDGSTVRDDSLTGAIPSTTEPIYVGALPDAEAPYQFPIIGTIDELRISDVWRSSIAVPSTPLALDSDTIGLYRFDSADSNSFPDESVLGNPALLSTTDGMLKMTTFVRKSGSWVPFFDGGHPLLEGAAFNLEPDTYAVQEDSDTRKAVLFAGIHPTEGYNWDALVEANAGSPMIKFTVTCHLSSALSIASEPQPTAAFWMNKPSADVLVEQGPMSIYGGTNYGLGFPAAYLWDQGKEAVVFFDMTPMTWMGPGNIRRFRDCRIKSISQSGQFGLGLVPFAKSGNSIDAGDMVTQYYLYEGPRDSQPRKLEGLEKMVEVCSPLHPSTAWFPTNRIPPYELSWHVFAEKAIEELMLPNVTYHDEYSGWDDGPLNLVGQVLNIRTHPGRPYNTGWDNSTVNNHLSPWILFTRLNANQAKRDFAMMKKDALPLFYDPQAKMIRWGTRQPPHIGDTSMSWQNFFYHIETIRSARVLDPNDYNPAIAGRFLMATEGLMEYGHNADYVFGQFFNPFTKQAIVQQDRPDLGVIREPWQTGTYSLIMLYAYEMTNDKIYLQEAKTAIETLLTNMSFTVSNDHYNITYTDPADFPITELFGNAYGAVAAYKIYEIEGDTDFLRYSHDFIDTLLRLTFWYEDETDIYSRDLGNLGLFIPHGGAGNTTPWETTEAYFAITWLLKHYRYSPYEQLFLKLANLYRINSFHYYPATYTDTVRTLGIDDSVNPYHPVEPFYSMEYGGHTGVPACYMSNTGMWNHWLFDALAQAGDREIMVLNLDVLEDFQQAISSAKRNLVLFNPTQQTRSFILSLNSLADGNYNVTTKYSSTNICDFNSDGTVNSRDFNIIASQWMQPPASPSADVAEPKDSFVDYADLAVFADNWLTMDNTTKGTFTKQQLQTGITVKLDPMAHAEVTVENENEPAMEVSITSCRTAQDKIAYAYMLMQVRQRDYGDVSQQLKDLFQTAMNDYSNSSYSAAASKAQTIINALS